MSMLGRMFGFGRDEHYDAGIRLYDQGLYDDAIVELQEVVDNGKNAKADPLTYRLASFYIAESYANIGSAALQKHAYERAMSALGKALAINPNYADLHFHFGRACRKSGSLEQAAEAFRAAIAINAHFAKAHFHLGTTLYELGRYDAARQEIQRAGEIESGYRAGLVSDALAKDSDGNHTDALDLLSQVADTDIDDISFHTKVGTDLYRRGMYNEAATEFRKALDLNAGYADIRNHLAITLNALGRYDEAIEEFRRALDINPNYLEARTNLALTLHVRGDEADAATEFRAVLVRDPDNTVAKSHLSE